MQKWTQHTIFLTTITMIEPALVRLSCGGKLKRPLAMDGRLLHQEKSRRYRPWESENSHLTKEIFSSKKNKWLLQRDESSCKRKQQECTITEQ